MITYRFMTENDIEPVTALYVKYMYDSLYAQLGHKFVRTLLSGLLRSSREISIVCLDEDKLIGFITVSTNSQATSMELLLRKALPLGFHACVACCRSPRLLTTLIKTSEYFTKTGNQLDAAKAEMIFITVHPDYRRQRIGEQLIAKVLQEYKLHGVLRVKVTTIKSNQPVQLLLMRLGFKLRGFFSFYGKEMALYARSLKPEINSEA